MHNKSNPVNPKAEATTTDGKLWVWSRVLGWSTTAMPGGCQQTKRCCCSLVFVDPLLDLKRRGFIPQAVCRGWSLTQCLTGQMGRQSNTQRTTQCWFERCTYFVQAVAFHISEFCLLFSLSRPLLCQLVPSYISQNAFQCVPERNRGTVACSGMPEGWLINCELEIKVNEYWNFDLRWSTNATPVLASPISQSPRADPPSSVGSFRGSCPWIETQATARVFCVYLEIKSRWKIYSYLFNLFLLKNAVMF